MRAAPTAPAVPASEPPALHERAFDNLRFIRETMERAGSFTAISGWGIVTIGIAACIATPMARAAASPDRWLTIWAVTALIAVVVSTSATAGKARRSGTSIISGQARKLALAFAPAIIVGALLTAALVRLGTYGLLPGVWMLLYGTAVVAGGAFSVRIIPVMGLAFIAFGAVALFAPGGMGDWIMAAAFGGLHLLFGARIAWRHGG